MVASICHVHPSSPWSTICQQSLVRQLFRLISFVDRLSELYECCVLYLPNLSIISAPLYESVGRVVDASLIRYLPYILYDIVHLSISETLSSLAALLKLLSKLKTITLLYHSIFTFYIVSEMVTDLDHYKYSIIWYIRINNGNYLIFMKTQMNFLFEPSIKINIEIKFNWIFQFLSILKGIAFVKIYTLMSVDP